MTRVVRPTMRLRSASCTTCSEAASSALVACTHTMCALSMHGSTTDFAGNALDCPVCTGAGWGATVSSSVLPAAAGPVLQAHVLHCMALVPRTSSSSRMRGSAHSARAMAMRCFWPPDRAMPPLSPSCTQAAVQLGSHSCLQLTSTCHADCVRCCDAQTRRHPCQ